MNLTISLISDPQFSVLMQHSWQVQSLFVEILSDLICISTSILLLVMLSSMRRVSCESQVKVAVIYVICI